jgi:hypothetical protein
VRNDGPTDATGVVINDEMTLPANVSVQSVTATHGTHSAIGTPGGTWTIGNLANGVTATLTIVLDVGPFAPHGGVILNSASVAEQDPVDPDTGDNAETEDSTITAPPCPVIPRPTRTPQGQTPPPPTPFHPTPTASPFCLTGVPTYSPSPTPSPPPTNSPGPTPPTPGPGGPRPTRTPKVTATSLAELALLVEWP